MGNVQWKRSMRLFNFILFLGGFRPLKNAKEVRRLNRMSTREFRSYEKIKREEIFNFHKNCNRFYKSFLADKTIDSWNDIPTLSKIDYRRAGDSILSEGFKKSEVKTGSTSGSSGTPLRYYKDKQMHGLTWQAIKFRFDNLGLSLGEKQARFYGIPKGRFKYRIERIKDILLNRYRFVVFDMSDEAMEVFIQKFRRTDFKYIYGYTNSLVLFAKYLIKKNKVLKRDYCRSLKCCIVTAEQCTDVDLRILELALGVRVINEYGSSEVDVIAFTDNFGNWRISNELVYVEILDEKNQALPDGEVGKIVVTHLHNRAMPIIRYEVGDFGSIKRDQIGRCDVLVNLSGRLNDFAILPSGKRVPGFTMYYAAKEIVGDIDTISEYQIRQISRSEFLILVVCSEELNQSQVVKIQDLMRNYLEPNLKISVERVLYIDREKSGKFKHFIALSDVDSGK